MSEEGRKFIKETVKEKPVNRKKILMRLAVSAISGAIFAVVACGVAALLLPRWTSLGQTEIVDDGSGEDATELVADNQGNKEDIVDDSGDDAVTDVVTEAPIKADIDKPGDKDQVIPQPQVDSKELYDDALKTVYEAGFAADKSIVKVTGVTNELDLFNSPYENSKAGCGLIVGEKKRGILILTESDVIDDSTQISVEFADGVTADAIEYSADAITGLSMLLVPNENLDKEYQKNIKMAELAISFSPKIGQEILAIGAPQGSMHGVIRGNITSGGNQICMPDANYSYFLTDIANMKNATGFICNTKGEICGMLVESLAKDAPTEYISGIVISELKGVIDRLTDGLTMPYLGIYFNVVTEDVSQEYYIPRGIYVRETKMDSPAMMAGLMPGDIITHIDGDEVLFEAAYENKVKKLQMGKPVDITYRRQSSEGYIELHCQLVPGVY